MPPVRTFAVLFHITQQLSKISAMQLLTGLGVCMQTFSLVVGVVWRMNAQVCQTVGHEILHGRSTYGKQ